MPVPAPTSAMAEPGFSPSSPRNNAYIPARCFGRSCAYASTREENRSFELLARTAMAWFYSPPRQSYSSGHMESVITGVAYVLADNVDTDQISPAQSLSFNPSLPEE